MPTSSYTSMEATLLNILRLALSQVDGAPPLEIDQPRLSDAVETGADGQVDDRYRAVLMPGALEEAGDQLVNPPPFHLITVFQVGLHGIGSDTAVRRGFLQELGVIISAALEANPQLSGTASYARTIRRDTDTSHERGFAPETLLELAIEVEFDAPTRAG